MKSEVEFLRIQERESKSSSCKLYNNNSIELVCINLIAHTQAYNVSSYVPVLNIRTKTNYYKEVKLVMQMKSD